ncbi:hypothetical protein EVAR_64081_1 [Eumeta japonica]|uniref:Uncharacterized protein n=1 Tax=Eumeta variegata TaxID=151549 RepID=A0A4C1ZGB2_EUMVA|nr:hypothetical protein EVAR_64081_1 [Eumeta japonica]
MKEGAETMQYKLHAKAEQLKGNADNKAINQRWPSVKGLRSKSLNSNWEDCEGISLNRAPRCAFRAFRLPTGFRFYRYRKSRPQRMPSTGDRIRILRSVNRIDSWSLSTFMLLLFVSIDRANEVYFK